MEESSKIKDGSQVIIKTNNILKVFQIRKSRQIRVEKVRFTLDGAIGQNYGSTFEVKGGKLVKMENISSGNADMVPEQESTRDNRNLTDTSDNQKLKKEDINALRKDGMTGKEIVGHLIENSATFKDKTVFSQEKYIKKKKKKHLTQFTILRPNTRLLAQMYFSKGPTKICNLRQDSIAQILTYGNVHAGCKLMVVESVVGLLVGAILERMSSHGTVIQFYTGSAPSRQAMEAYNFPTVVKKTLLSFPLNQVNTLNREHCKCAAVRSSQITGKDITNVDGNVITEAQGDTVKPTNTDSVQTKVNTEHGEDSSQISVTKDNVLENISVEACTSVEKDGSSDGATAGTVEKDGNSEGATARIVEKDVSSEGATVRVNSINEGRDVITAESGDIKAESGDIITAESDDITEMSDAECRCSDDDDQVEEMDADEGGQISTESSKRKADWEAVKQRRRKYRLEENAKSKQLLESGTLDGLILCTKYHPTPIVMSLIDFVAPSRPIVIFSQYKEPLLDCYVKLRDRGGVISLRLSETWLRKYQVLSNRTHPESNMCGTGGYLLTGTTVLMDK